MTLEVIKFMSTNDVPSNTTLPPLESHLYNSIYTCRLSFEFIEKCVFHAQLPAGMKVTPGTFESVLNVANRCLTFPLKL